MRVLARLALGTMLALALCGGGLARAGAELGFPQPTALQPNVDFWLDVFTKYSDHDFIIHDRDQVSRVYYVFHMPGYGPPSTRDIDWANDYLKNKYGAILTHLASGAPPRDYEEQRIATMFKGEPLSAYALAAQNLRVQQGLRELFRYSFLRSRYYRPTMERIFRGEGLPPDLVTLATVESGFYARAHSSAGAVGIWQFTRSTGREYLAIGRCRDERLDPVRETEAAAQLLRYNYQVLGNWPLAITAYDYGTAGMERAAEENDRDYERVLTSYNGPHFGFAAKNYYAEFLAAVKVNRDAEKYFPGIEAEEVPPPPRVSQIVCHPSSHRHRVLRRAGGTTHRSIHRRAHLRRVALRTRHKTSRGEPSHI